MENIFKHLFEYHKAIQLSLHFLTIVLTCLHYPQGFLFECIPILESTVYEYDFV